MPTGYRWLAEANIKLQDWCYGNGYRGIWNFRQKIPCRILRAVPLSVDRPVVLVTGSSSGIGRAICDAFHHRGCRVVATARQPDALADLQHAGMLTLPLDVTDPVERQATVETVLQQLGRLDILVNNAGYGQFGPLMDLAVEDLQRQLATNTLAPLALIQQVAPVMKRQGQGVIVNIGSISGVVTTPFAGAYCASKAALHAISDALRMELHPFGIHVITVQPGAIQSNFGNAAATALDTQDSSQSWYGPLQEKISNRATLSQKQATPTKIFAEQLVNQLLRPNPPKILRLGKKSRWLPLLRQILPTSLFEALLRRQFGLVASAWQNPEL